jgi:GNAT superfamily N-acetyltransferase
VRRMDDARLASLEHANLIEAVGLPAATLPSGLLRREGGVALLSAGGPLRIFNQVAIDPEDDGATPEAIAAGVAILRERGAPFVVNLRAGIDDRFVPLMADLGLVLLYGGPWMPGMAMHPIPPDPSGAVTRRAGRPSGGQALPHLEISVATDETDIGDHVRVATAGFGMPEGMMDAIVTTAFLGLEHVAVYVGRLDGEPVVSGMGVRTGRCIGVYGIATVREARGQGFATLMTARVVSDGAAAGCDVAVLQASDMGFPLYERMGFRTVVEHMAWGLPEPVGDG